MTGVDLLDFNNDTGIFKVKHNLHLHKELPKATKAVVGAGPGGVKAHWCIQALTVFASPAVQEAVLGRSYNPLTPRMKILYADTVDSDSISDIMKTIEPALKNGGAVVINGVSKSGGTSETIANFEILADLLRRCNKQYEKDIVVTTDRNSVF